MALASSAAPANVMEFPRQSLIAYLVQACPLCWARRVTKRILYGRERLGVIIVTANITEQGQKVVQGVLIIDPTRSHDAILHAIA